MSRQWKPGDVAMVMCSDGRERQATCEPHPNFAGVLAWRFPDRVYRDVESSLARPLVVIDAEDESQASRLALAFWAGKNVGAEGMQAALRSLVTDPRPEEPLGLGAVVEDSDGFAWVRTHATGYPWHANLDASDRNCTAVRKYADIAAVRVLSEGVVRP